MAGAPTKYKPEYCDQAYRLCLLGHTDAELATYFEVEEKTINNWKNTYPEFLQSIKRGKAPADGKVAESLYKRATGYDAPDTDIRVVNGELVLTPIIKHYPPDPVSMIFWLTNRQRQIWRQKQADEAPPPPSNILSEEQFQQLLNAARNATNDQGQ